MINETEIIILKELIKDLTKQMSILEISRIIKKPYKQTYQNMKRLEKKGLITTINIGKSSLCIYNYAKELITTCYIESLRTGDFLEKNKKVEILAEKLAKELKTVNCTIIIFGSYVKKTQTKTSDIDIAIITEEPHLEEAERTAKYASNLSTVSTHIIEFTYQDLTKMLLEKKEINVGKEIIKNHVILTGYENFYKTMEKSGWERALIQIP